MRIVHTYRRRDEALQCLLRLLANGESARPLSPVAARGFIGRTWDDGCMPPEEAPKQPARVSPPDTQDEPVLPTQSQDDTDVGWGEPPGPDDDERLYRERPPHWGSS
jgi:hypothetical protein